MTKATLISIILILMIGLCSCMPTTSVKSLDSRPSIAITNAPRGAVLYVDGELIGEAKNYDGKPNVLILERGTHVVTIKARDGTTLLERTIFVHSELKTIAVN